MMAEIRKYTGTESGSIHNVDLDAGNLGANGSLVWDQAQQQGKRLVRLSASRDGATNEGVFREAVNMASIWKLLSNFYCINNGYAIWQENDQYSAHS